MLDYDEHIKRYVELRKKNFDLNHEEAWNLTRDGMPKMTRYNHLEPGLGGPTFYESIFVAMLFTLWIFIMLGCAVGELTVRLFPPNRHERV